MKRDMKYIVFCLALISPFFQVLAQSVVLEGIVSVHNSRYRTGQTEFVAGVFVTAPFAAPAMTDANGRFRLEFVGMNGGISVAVQVEKSGFEVVNSRDLLDVIIGRKAPLLVYLAPKGQLYQVQAELYNINMRALTARYEQLITRLSKEGAESQAAIAELEKQLGRTIANRFEAEKLLNKQLEENQKHLPELTRELGTVNLDFASDSYRQAYEFYQNGEIEKAIETLDETKLDKEAEEALKDLAQIELDMASWEEAKQSNEQLLQQLIESYNLKAQLYSVNRQYLEEAEMNKRAIALLETVMKEPDRELAKAYQAAGAAFKRIGRYAEALPYFEKQLTVLEHILRSERRLMELNDEMFIAAHNDLATTLAALGRSLEAVELLERLIQRFSKKFGPDYTLNAECYTILAEVKETSKAHSEAEAALLKAIELRIDKLGRYHPTTAKSYVKLAALLEYLGRYAEAKSFLEEAVTAAEKNYGGKHPETAGNRARLALMIKELGQHDELIKVLEETVSAYSESVGEDHPLTIQGYADLGVAHQYLGDYGKARALLEKAVTWNEANIGIDHPTTIDFYAKLANVLRDVANYGEARTLLEKVVAFNVKNLGEDHPTTAQSYNNLSFVLQDLGDYAEAKALFEKALASNERNFGPDHPTTARTYSNLALVLKELGDYAGAKTLLEKAMASSERNFGPDHPSTARTYSNLATVLKDLGDYDGAKGLLEKAMASDERNFGADHPTTAVSYTNIGSVLADMGDYPQARHYLQKALGVFREQLGEGHPRTQALVSLLEQLEALEKQNPPSNTQATPYLNAAQQHRTAGNYRAAIESYQKALPLVAQPAELYNFIGLCHYYLKEYAQALQHYEQSYQLDSTDAWIYLNNSGLAHAKAGNLEEAKRRFERLQALIPDEGLPYRNWCVYYAIKEDTEQALANLEEAVQRGYDNLEWIETDEALEGLRGEARYKAIVEQLKGN